MADIELVIKLPEETYNDIQSKDWKNGDLIFSEEWKAIHYGTPLPKLIDDIKAEITTEISDYEGCADFNEGIGFGLRTALKIIDKHISGKGSEDLGDYPDAIHNQFDNMTGSMNL